MILVVPPLGARAQSSGQAPCEKAWLREASVYVHVHARAIRVARTILRTYHLAARYSQG